MDDLPADHFSLYDNWRKYYRTRHDGGLNDISQEAVDSFFATLCAVGWGLEKAATRRECD